MIKVFGGVLHCFHGPGGCRSQGLYFSLALPRKPVFSTLSPISAPEADREDHATDPTGEGNNLTAIQLSVSNDLAPKIDGALLDFGDYNNLERFIWLTLPAVKGPRCTCRRSFGPAAGKRSPCLDDRRLELSGP
ncbi:peptidase [Arthrobacter sp. 260]|uniref:peptidase n=1 Tax=Arthrobacter sp. 260 TaxID=2735314 RepID=UPI001492DF7C|nr:peptidase [Arthrobacter sp. 260]NOJ61613.1 peptidase [Arthrobacter sp. 260]